jgi:hypothetical protein
VEPEVQETSASEAAPPEVQETPAPETMPEEGES